MPGACSRRKGKIAISPSEHWTHPKSSSKEKMISTVVNLVDRHYFLNPEYLSPIHLQGPPHPLAQKGLEKLLQPPPDCESQLIQPKKLNLKRYRWQVTEVRDKWQETEVRDEWQETGDRRQRSGTNDRRQVTGDRGQGQMTGYRWQGSGERTQETWKFSIGLVITD